MGRIAYWAKRVIRWLGLLVLVAALPLFVRATSQLPEDVIAAPTATEAPLSTPTPSPVIVVVTAPPVQQTASITPQEDTAPLVVEEGISFSDGDSEDTDVIVTAQAAAEPAVLTAEAPTDEAGDEPEEDTGIWTYDSDSIQVSIERKQQDDFVYFVADIQLTSADQFTYAFSNEKYGAREEALSDIAERHNPLIAINGDYYSFHNNGIIIRGGELFRKQNSARALLIVEENGDLAVLTDRTEKQGVVANQLVERGVRHTFEFGPVLVREKEAVKLNSAIVRVADGYLEPRTAIGQLGPLHYLVIVVDGRSEGYSAGCDLPTLQQLFMDHGVETAFNLDGGGSTTLWFNGEVINQPAAGDERRVSDIVMFVE